MTSDPVAHEQCGACGFDGTPFSDDSLLAALDGLGRRWRALLHDAGPDVHVRPAPQVWSAVEYAAHSRDVIGLHVHGVREALTGSERVYPPLREPPQPSPEPNSALDPSEVADALGAQASALASTARDAGTDLWTRGITVGTTRSDVRRMLEHSLHDSQHHLDDVARGLEQIRR